MLVYFITRFSIFDYNFKGYQITKMSSIEKYKSYLFSKKRLDYKFNSFENITLPSIVSQTDNNYIWEIYTSEYLPIEYKNRLLASTNKYKNIKIFYIKSFKEFNKSDKIKDKYCTVRLDDDDGLNKNFVKILQRYKGKTKEIISFTKGKKCTLLNNKIIYGENVEYKNNAQGLCAIDMNIYNCGNHVKVDKKFKVTYDMTPDMYLVNCGNFCDSKRKFTYKNDFQTEYLFEKSDTKNNIENFSINELIIYKTHYNKLRIGRNGDGGYVLLDIPNINYDIFISGGISNDDSFEHEFINKYKNISCEAFDFSLDKLPHSSDRIKFNKKFINTINNDKYTNLELYMEKYKNIFLKLDIEGSEHKWFEYLNDIQLNSISQMVVKFHYYPNITKNLKYFSKINKFFYLVHLHANNSRTKLNNSGLFDYKGNNIPWVFECTFINKRYIDNVKVNNIQVPDNSFDYKNIHSNDDINLNYFPYKFDYDKLITLIPADNGHENQIIGIKECLILSKLLNRTCIIPPIREHYVKSNNIFYNFNDIFRLNDTNIIIDNETSNILNHIDNNKRYCIHSNYFNKKLRHEDIINSTNNNEIILKKRLIKNKQNLDELENIDDNLIIIKHLFNNVYINESGINGDFYSDFNCNFKDIYTEISSKWDYSDYIKLHGNEYIKNTFNNLDFNAIHIRLPDVMYKKSIDEYTNNEYSDDKIVKICLKLKSKNNNPIFIASNNINYLKKIGVVANFINITNKYNSFIEQYICGMSEKFYYLNLENTSDSKRCNRSTWTSFVIDYRFFLRKINKNYII